MFGITDLITVAIIEDGFKFLANNPVHLNFILDSLTHWEGVRNKISKDHINNVIDYVSNNKIHIAPYYEIDNDRVPGIFVVSSGSEKEQFIGDQSLVGVDYNNYFSKVNNNKYLGPKIYAEWTADRFSNEELIVSSDYNLVDKLWKGVFIANGSFVSQLDSIFNVSSNGVTKTMLVLKDPIPTNLDKRLWKAQSDIKRNRYDLSASVDSVQIQCKLITSGTYQLHRILSIILRYCLKSRRLLFAQNHIYNTFISYTPPMINDEFQDKVFESVYTISCECAEHWIQNAYELPDRGARIALDVEAVKSSLDVDSNVMVLEDES